MAEFIKRMSPGTEFAIVMAVGFGSFTLSSIAGYFDPQAPSPYTEESLTALLIYETIVFIALAAFMSARGWTLSAIGLKPDAAQSLTGFGLAFASFVLFSVVYAMQGSILPAASDSDMQTVAANIPLSTVAALSAVNAVYEEVLVAGYMMSALMEKYSAAIAIAASAGLRATYHLYQGAFSAASIGLLGVMFAVYYARRGKLWPLIVAHALIDFIELFAATSQT